MEDLAPIASLFRPLPSRHPGFTPGASDRVVLRLRASGIRGVPGGGKLALRSSKRREAYLSRSPRRRTSLAARHHGTASTCRLYVPSVILRKEHDDGKLLVRRV